MLGIDLMDGKPGNLGVQMSVGGKKLGGIITTEEDDADAIFDEGALDGELPRNEDEAGAIRNAVRGSGGPLEMEEDNLDDPNRSGQQEIEVYDYERGVRVHLWEDTKTGIRTEDKIKDRH